jgi:hypothetical protein
MDSRTRARLFRRNERSMKRGRPSEKWHCAWCRLHWPRQCAVLTLWLAALKADKLFKGIR